LKEIIAYVAMAVTFGVIVMLIPIMVFAPFYVATDVRTDVSQQENGSKTVPTPQTFNALEEAAQTYGRIDTGPAPFPASLLHVMLIVAVGFSFALGVSQYYKRRIR